MKKLPSLITYTAFVFSLILYFTVPVFASEVDDSINDVLKYVLLDNNTAEISYYDSLNTEFNIPDTIDGYTVTSIGKKAFKGCHALRTVTIPDTVTVINNQAFEQCQSLKTVSIGKGVKTIGYKAFSDCKSLINVNIPDGVTSIGKDAFLRCFSLDSINIPSSITSIGNYAFSDCTHLRKVTIKNANVSIGEFAFGWCLSLNEITLESNTVYVGYNAFVACDSLKSITIENKDCIIYDHKDTIPPDAVIYGYNNSTASAYAEKYGREFINLSEDTEYTKGDVDGDSKITIMDTTTIQRANAKYFTLSDTQILAADVDGDSKITVMDATKIQRYVAKVIDEI